MISFRPCRSRPLPLRRQRRACAGEYTPVSPIEAYDDLRPNELAPRVIRVDVVSPGPIDTAMFDAATDEMREALTKLIPLGRLGRPEEVAAATLFLASDESRFITGAGLCVDGGMAQV